MLPSHNMQSCKNSVISPRFSHVSTLSKFVPFTMPDQNIQCTNAPSKSVTCSTVNSNVNSGVNVTRKNTVNVISDSVIAPVSPLLSPYSDDFTPQCYSDSLKRRKRMAGKIVSFCQDCNSVNNDHSLVLCILLSNCDRLLHHNVYKLTQKERGSTQTN